jgi:hypothetical protein
MLTVISSGLHVSNLAAVHHPKYHIAMPEILFNTYHCGDTLGQCTFKSLFRIFFLGNGEISITRSQAYWKYGGETYYQYHERQLLFAVVKAKDEKEAELLSRNMMEILAASIHPY